MQWRVPVCAPDAVISLSAREPMEIAPDQAICVFGKRLATLWCLLSLFLSAGATLQHFKSTGYDTDATILNVGRSTFWIVGRTDMLPPETRDWVAGRPDLL